MITKNILRGFVSAAAFVALLSVASSCSGHKPQLALTAWNSSVPPNQANLAEPRETTLDSALAEIENLQPPDGVSTSIFAELKSALASALRSNGVSKYVSKPPTGQQNRVTDLTPIDDGAGGYLLMWHYHNLGDYNQNGSVGVSDITPLAIYFNQNAPDPNSVQGVVDGDGSGDIRVADVTPIAMNFSSECAGYLVQSAPTADGPWTSPGEFVPFAAGFGAGRPVFQFPLPTAAGGYARVVPVDGANQPGIESNVVAIIAVSESPKVVSVTPEEGIAGDSLALSAVVTGTPPVTYAWDFGGGAAPNTSTDASPIVTLGAVGNYLASVQVSNGFGNDTFEFALTVTSSGNPPVIGSVSPKEGITGSFITLAANSTGTSPYSYSWEFGGGAAPNTSASARPVVSLGAAGSYLASLTVTNDYGSDTYSFTLTVTDSGNAPIIGSVSPREGIIGSNINLAADIAGTSPFSYSWDFGGGAAPNTSTSSNPTVSLGTAGSYLASLNVTNSYGSDTYYFILTATDSGRPPLIEGVSPGEGIAGSFITLTANLRGTSPLSFSWDFSSGATPSTSTSANPTVSLATVGGYPASLIVTNLYGSDAYNFTLTVTESGHSPVIGDVSPREGIAGSYVTLAADITGTLPLSYSWDFGGGATPNTSMAARPTVTMGAAGSYSASLTVSNAFGSDTYDFLLTVSESGNPPVVGSVSPKEGVAGSEITLAADATGTSPFSYSWDFGGGAIPNASTNENPTVTLGAPGSYLAILVVTNAYGNDMYGFILNVTDIGNPPLIDSLSPEEGIEGTPTTFTANISGTSPINYSWNFGGGATPNTSAVASPTVTMGASGTYTASLTVTSDYGSDTYDFFLDVTEIGNPPLIGGVSPNEGIPDSYLTFGADFTGTSPFSYSWNFGGGAIPNTSSSPNPTATLGAAGSHLASLTVTNAFGSDNYNFTLTVTANGRPPVINGVTPTQGVKGTRTTFTVDATGTSPLSYSWNFGGGATPNTSRKSRPRVKLKSPHGYSASVTVTNAFGSDTLDFTLLVTP
jgi:PKD repeat protein